MQARNMVTELPDSVVERQEIFVGGEWLACRGDRVVVEDPFTEEEFGSVPRAGETEAVQAVLAARAAMPAWSARPVHERAELLEEIALRLQAKADLMAAVVQREVGVPHSQLHPMQVELAVEAFRQAAAAVEQMSWRWQEHNSTVVRMPYGPVLCIVPWNVPLYQSALKVASALAAGNTVILKPSELAPIATFLMADAVQEAKVPAGVFNLVSGDGDTGSALVRQPGLGMISFTGSTDTGRRILQTAAQAIVPVSLELGGKGAALVLDHEVLADAVAGAVRSCLALSGQTCAATTRLLVLREHRAEAEELVAHQLDRQRVGDPADPATTIGPLISRGQRDRVVQMLDRVALTQARAVTAPLVTPDQGHFVAPMAFSGVRPEDDIAQDEIFGPVLSIIEVADEDEGVDVANGTRYGLSHAVWAADPHRAFEVGRRLQGGSVYINGGRFNPHAPFGGMKESGYGRERGASGVEEFTQTQSLHQ